MRPLPRTFGGHFIERVVNDRVVYPHVLALYSKLRSMPAFDTRAITEQQRVDIVAYILRANGLPAGTEEIPVDIDAMRLMMINEPGFERIFNGRDFTGWNFVIGRNCAAAAPDGCGQDGTAGRRSGRTPNNGLRVLHQRTLVHGQKIQGLHAALRDQVRAAT